MPLAYFMHALRFQDVVQSNADERGRKTTATFISLGPRWRYPSCMNSCSLSPSPLLHTHILATLDRDSCRIILVSHSTTVQYSMPRKRSPTTSTVILEGIYQIVMISDLLSVRQNLVGIIWHLHRASGIFFCSKILLYTILRGCPQSPARTTLMGAIWHSAMDRMRVKSSVIYGGHQQAT